MKNLYILGSTGSIGTQTLDIVRNQKEDFKVIGMSVGSSNLELGYQLIEEFKPVEQLVAEQSAVQAPVAVAPVIEPQVITPPTVTAPVVEGLPSVSLEQPINNEPVIDTSSFIASPVAPPTTSDQSEGSGVPTEFTPINITNIQ